MSKKWEAVHSSGRRGLFRVLARGSFLFGGEFSKTPTMISALSLPNFCLSPQKCPRFMQFSRFSYTKPQVMGLLESLDSFDKNRRYVMSVGRLTSFWKIWPGKMPAEARVNGFLRTRGLTYRRLLSTALCFSRRSVVESQWEKGGSGGDASSTRGIAPGSRLDSP